MCVRSVVQSCPTLCDPVDCSPPGFSVHGIPQARILEWVATSFSRGSSPPRDRTCVSCIGQPGKPNIRKGIPWTNRAWQATVRGVAKTWTQLSTHAFMFTRLLKKEMTQEQHRKERPCRMWGGRAVPLSVHSPQISHNPVLLGFLEASLRRFDGSAHWPSLRAQSAH